MFNEKQPYSTIFCAVWRFLGLSYESGASFESTSGAEINFIDLLNATVVDGWFALKRENERMKELLRKKSSAAEISYKKTSGRKRK